MKKVFFLIALLIAFKVNAQCNHLKNKEMKEMLGSFIYDSSRETAIKENENAQQIEFELLLFKSNMYKMCWEISELPPNSTIKLYEKTNNGGKKMIFNSETSEPDKNFYSVVLKDISRSVIVTYNIPESTTGGCVKYVLGFSMKNEIKQEKNPKARVKVN
ncbi:MAG: hypothetical protein HND27_01585 [Bacteroidetes bacterium]|nr:hypothetical protein [Bacteroidota bacterium]MBV6460517.1 hypothetical protein [Flavobacteriales bacterium]WKZ74265.1 MAG: hypothetical protein QY303_08920 [Vicingaceae bacterium]MCL4815931.1 hypothetical protein [Flavobacteriales bacterium]NOG94449.1 hypothetical protein [Bacteroidota bacterium]